MPPVDTKPPDVKPWNCTTPAQCNDKNPCTADACTAGQCTNKPRPNGTACPLDGKSCTTDVCQAGKCVHPVINARCLIGSVCYVQGQSNPKGNCQSCDPGKSKTKWSIAADKTPCAGDGLTCTADICLKGKCTHDLATGCMINGKCVAEGKGTSADPCKACVSSKSTTGYTAAAGLPCAGAGNKPAFCGSNGKCTPINGKLFASKGAFNTSLRSVAYIPAAQATWAAGVTEVTTSSAPKGVLIEADGSATTKEVQVAKPLRWIHHQVAVGDKGAVLRYESTTGTWGTEGALSKALAGQDRQAVWGAKVKGVETYYLVGGQSSKLSAVLRCSLGATGFTCAAHTGVSAGRSLGRVFGTLGSGGGQGPLWGLVMGNNTPEDVYYNAGTTTTWSTAAPAGCKDAYGQPCGNTPYNSYDLNGSGPSDLWLVGSQGMILRYNGKVWDKVTGVIPSPSSTHFTAVYSSAKDKLTTLAAYRNSGGSKGHKVQLFNYNHDLKVWFGPINLSETAYGTPDYVLAMGGKGYTDLWLVGQRQITGSGGKPQLSGWMMQLK